MCGIAGLFKIKEKVRSEELVSLLGAIKHRGPDNTDYKIRGNVGLGHNRLSIIDISSNGNQPMVSQNENYILVFNGEIYNFKSIRTELVKLGYSFRSKSDTEVVLACYEKYGADCLGKFQGMFAFAIWDSKKNLLFVARDRMGQKPFYYYSDHERFVFASEIKSILKLKWVPDEIDLIALRQYFMLQYILGPRTIFKSIYKLMPGQFMMIKQSSSGLRYDKQTYWQLSDYNVIDHENESDIDNTIEHLLNQSVRLRLISDVDVGVLLSGGLDSSLIAALATKNSNVPIRSFSVGFKNHVNLDEREYSDIVAKKLGTDHRVLLADDVKADTLVKVIYHLDEPLADPAAIPTYLISSLTAEHVKVVLTGEGADELFGGYPHYVYENIWQYIFKLPDAVQNYIIHLLGGSLSLLKERRSVARLIKVISSPQDIGAMRWVNIFGKNDFERFLSPGFVATGGEKNVFQLVSKIYNKSNKSSLLGKALDLDALTWLPDDLLMKVDKMTMAHSLEARAPFLDHKLIEYVTSLETCNKISGTRTKVKLKKIAKKYLPDTILQRKKQGFEVPISNWILYNFRDLAEDVFSLDNLSNIGIFNAKNIHKEWLMMKKNNRAYYPRMMWVLFCFLLWNKQYR